MFSLSLTKKDRLGISQKNYQQNQDENVEEDENDSNLVLRAVAVGSRCNSPCQSEDWCQLLLLSMIYYIIIIIIRLSIVVIVSILLYLYENLFCNVLFFNHPVN